MGPTACFLMCPPRHFGVTYAINPWMDPATWARDEVTLGQSSQHEWDRLRSVLRGLGGAIETMRPRRGVPDLVFTANAAVVLDGIALLARFRHQERQAEEPFVARAFRELRARGLIDAAHQLPDGLVLEGAGDCVWDQARQLFWMGYGPRSDADARGVVEDTFSVDAVALELADPRFYHLDTAFCPLPRGEVVYFPGAFTAAGHDEIRERIAPEARIEIAEDDACRLAANAVCVGDTVVLSGCGERLRDVLAERGYEVVPTALGSFLRSGGAAFCLTLRLDRRSAAGRSLAAAPPSIPAGSSRSLNPEGSRPANA